ncbi:Hint domain-containing protein [Methylorubrum extorquens]|uniref:Hint domain-containing protein n=1 Tax=Methylorubrum extorquens TaxID=408 RepID=UPI003F61469C
MGSVTQKTGFVDSPFFNRTIYPIENIATAGSFQYSTTGFGSTILSPLPPDLSGYVAIGLNNEGDTSHYLYGIRPDGSEEPLGIHTIPTMRSGVVVTSQTRVDNADMFVLQKLNENNYLVFSNNTLPPPDTALTFTSSQGDYKLVLCFVSGTNISTSRGEVAVEDLQVGDLAATATGALRRIIWIGHRKIASESASLAFNQQPVRVRAGAFGPGLPARDLFLSPGHPVLVGADADNEGGVLVPVMCLINGTTVTREPVTSVTYWHVELDVHDILLAEGLPAESYIDGGDRTFFSEGSDHALHNPDFVPQGWGARCRPVAVDGPVVEAERLRLDAVFAGSLSEQCEWDAASAWKMA